MKRLIASMLAACLVTGAAAAAEPDTTQNAQLEAVTRSVKAQLDIGDQYTDFYGQLDDDGLEPYWNLQWEAPGERIGVEASQDGVIRWYSRNTDGIARYGDDFPPQLPKITREQAQAAAQAFAKRVLKSGETVVFEENTDSARPLNTDSFYLYGTLHYNGLPTPVSISMSVRTSNLEVYRYNRNADKRVGAIPSKTPSVRQADAAALLRGTRKLQLVYTTQTGDGKPLDKAVLRYVPEDVDNFIVDAQSGKLVNLTALMEQLARNGATADASAGDGGTMSGAAKEQGLSEAEQQGADLLRDVLSKEALDQKLRAMGELGLSGFQIMNASYRVNRESKDVSCYLSYTKGSGEAQAHKYASVDAKTGALQSLYTYGEAPEQPAGRYTGEAAQTQAEAFLAKYESARFAKTGLYKSDEGDNRAVSLVYAQQENGYPFPENQYTVGINRENGTVDRFTSSWTEGVTFDDAQNLIGADQAMDAYFGSFTVTLGYIAVPVKIDPNIYPQYAKAGYTYLYEWRLGYQAEQDGRCYGVDAKTGEALFIKTAKAEGLQYGDVDLAKYPQAATLASYGIGFTGGALQPQKQLTQADLLALLLSTDGYSYDPEAEKGLDQLYEAAYSRGLLTRTERAPEAAVTRTGLVKMLISAAGYGKAAELPGIYRTTFTDEAAIPAADLGYVAIAQGMGLVRGDEKGRFQPGDAATREQAIIVLYNYMSR
ncbi:S-layer homology domain-containing protein [Intestinibacillus massiliensis]|uniref:S-layer homology domain-containing protein n=1 Tax=Intestinibacillus massiliensis TaxID=1871029 RepID=UPI00135636C4|nr:S-layer homology domain-containing protein [Intestinibacillus massiliensis]